MIVTIADIVSVAALLILVVCIIRGLYDTLDGGGQSKSE